MYCTKCGKEIDSAANYCVYCGNQLTAVKQQAIITQKPTKASFVISEAFKTHKEQEIILKKLEEQFRTVSKKVERRGENELCVKSIAKTFLISDQRKDTSIVILDKTDSKYVCTVYVKYELPIFDKIILFFLFIGLFIFQWFSILGIIVIIYILICYFSQKNTVRSAIQDTLKQVKVAIED